MRTTTMKRIWVAALALVLAGGVSACADEPMGVEEASYEPQLDGKSECVLINGVVRCS